MKKVEEIHSYLNYSLENNNQVFTHQFHNAPELGERFTKVENKKDWEFLFKLPNEILKNLPNRDIQIGEITHKFDAQILRIMFSFEREIRLVVLIRYENKDHNFHKDEEIDIDKIPGLRAWLHDTHNKVHLEHGLKPRWGNGKIEEEGKQ